VVAHLNASTFPLPVIAHLNLSTSPLNVVAHLNASTFPVPTRSHQGGNWHVAAHVTIQGREGNLAVVDSTGALSVSGLISTLSTLSHVTSVTHVASFIQPRNVILVGQQAVTTTATALPSHVAARVCIRVMTGGTQNVFFGPSTVSITNGMQLAPGESYCTETGNAANFFVVAPGTGSTAGWMIER
jgi:hypothetical protein